MNLTDIYTRDDRHELLYRLLQEREEVSSISHKEMPTFEDHIKFVESRPYTAWYVVGSNSGDYRWDYGACYLSKQNEVGCFIFRDYRGKGYGRAALRMMMEKHGPARYLCNLNPKNEPSARMVKSIGFKHIQDTYELV